MATNKYKHTPLFGNILCDIIRINEHWFQGEKKTVGPDLFSTCWVIFETASPTCLQWYKKYAVLSVPKGLPPRGRMTGLSGGAG